MCAKNSHNHVKLSKLLVEHGADLNMKNVLGATCLDVAMKSVYHYLRGTKNRFFSD